MSDLVFSQRPDQFHVWITVLIQSYETGIIHGLVKRGYIVSAADSEGNISTTFKGAASTIIALRVEKQLVSRTSLLSDLHSTLEEMKAQFFSVVISEHTLNCTWMGSNIRISNSDVLEAKPVDKKAN